MRRKCSLQNDWPPASPVIARDPQPIERARDPSVSPSHDARDVRSLRDEIESSDGEEDVNLVGPNTWRYTAVRKSFGSYAIGIVAISRGWDGVDPYKERGIIYHDVL